LKAKKAEDKILDSNHKTAVLLLGYSRPDLTGKRLSELEPIRSMGINIISSVDAYDNSDGGKILHNFKELQEKFDQVNWIFQKKKLGLATHLVKRVTECLFEYDRVVILEDDVKCEPKGIQSIIKLYEKGIPNDVMTVGLFGFLPSFGFPRIKTNNWRKTPYFSAWGWCIDRTKWNLFDLDIVKKNQLASIEKSAIWKSLNDSQRARWRYRFTKVCNDPHLTWDYQIQFTSWLNNLSHLLPIHRACDNEGFGDSRATNTKEVRPKWYRGPTSNHEIGDKVITTNSFRSKSLVKLDSFTWIGDRKIQDFFSNS